MFRNLPSPVPPFVFPTRAIHVDDHEAYLSAIIANLTVLTHVDSFASAGEALDEISSAQGGPAALRALVHRERDRTSTDNSLVLDVAAILHIMYDPDRFALPTVVVADYAMPEMTGIELLRSCGDRNIGRILLTGQADRNTVISAFNEGLIDQYIEKSAIDAPESIDAAIASLQWRYFAKSYANVGQALSRDDYRILWDKKAMEHIVASLDIQPIEMYLVPNPSGLLFLDASGGAEFVLIVSDAALGDQAEAADEAGIPAEDLARIDREQAVAVFDPGERGFVAGKANYDLVAVRRFTSPEGAYHLGKLGDLRRFRLDEVTFYDEWAAARSES